MIYFQLPAFYFFLFRFSFWFKRILAMSGNCFLICFQPIQRRCFRLSIGNQIFGGLDGQSHASTVHSTIIRRICAGAFCDHTVALLRGYISKAVNMHTRELHFFESRIDSLCAGAGCDDGCTCGASRICPSCAKALSMI